MRSFSYISRYSRYDTSAGAEGLNVDDLMAELSDALLSHGDLQSALRSLMQEGLHRQPMMGLQELLQRLKAKRQQMQDEHSVDSVVEALHERLKEILQIEQNSIQRRLDENQQNPSQGVQQEATPQRQGGESAQKDPAGSQGQEGGQQGEPPEEGDFLEEWAQSKLEFLQNLPKDLASALPGLSNYDFYDAEAERLYQELMEELKDQATKGLQQMSQNFQSSDPNQLSQMQELLQQLNQMMAQQMQGNDINQALQQFLQQWMPEAQRPHSLEELLGNFQGQSQPMQSLLQSLSGPQQEELQNVLDQLFQDMGLQEQLQELMKAMSQMLPKDQSSRYSFQGNVEMDLQEALKMMQEMGQLDELEKELRKAQYNEGLDSLDPEKLRELLGEEEAQSMELLQKLTEALQNAGYLRQHGDQLELTPRAMRMIGQKAMRDIFEQLKQGRVGNHENRLHGAGIEQLEEAKHYEFGDPFLVDLQQTVLNALTREGPGVPVHLEASDFDVYRTERQTQSSTVLMLDLSWSMARRGSFFAAKKVILALHSLIKTQFPRDTIYVVGFSTYARELKAEQLPYITWDQSEPYTNMQQGFMVSQKLLSRHKHGTKQILMISDGEPTAHMEHGQVYLGYPPSPRTITETLREVRRCTHEGIVINVFMLDRSYYLKEFVDQMTRINRGRAFYTSPETLGQYVMVDYLTGKRRKIA